MRRIVCAALPAWSLDRRRRLAGPAAPPEAAAFALIAPQAGGLRLAALSPAAAAAGLRVGMALAQARALAPGLIVEDADPAADAAGLTQLARWCGRFSPWTAVAPGAPGLWLDVTGVAALFGGEAGLLGAIRTGLCGLGLSVRLALADTPGAAHALAWFHPDARAGLIAPPGGHRALIAPLPVEALRIPDQTTAGLRALGLRTIGDVARLPAAGLARRFGRGLVEALEQAQGLRPEPITPLAPVAPRRVRVRLAEPLLTLPGLEEAMRRAVTELCGVLAREGEGARRLELLFYRVDGAVLALGAGAAQPLADPARWLRLLKEHLAKEEERLDLAFGVDLVEARAGALARVAPEARPLDPEAAGAITAADGALALADTLAARLGPARVGRLRPVESHWPERAQTVAPASADRTKDVAARLPAAPRPPLLLPRPEPASALAELPDGPPRQLSWRRRAWRISRAEGPERILPEWWRAEPHDALRDYYALETEEGCRLWVFRAGAFGGQPAPAWFVQGLWP